VGVLDRPVRLAFVEACRGREVALALVAASAEDREWVNETSSV
jgi:hypothetical protein